ncbi:MAG: GNAT family N-acetyltransferase [Deltaproteobacteria bacterium]|nr:MAG: GNAT family N-acetyltransferase [Deltaproteobacteria bacterium]
MAEEGPPKIRKFKREDIHRILEIEEEAFPKTAYPRETFLYYANRVPDNFMILETGDDVAGYIIFDMDGHIHSTAVKPAHRRKGFGKMLFHHALESVKKRLWLEVRSKNSGAIAFYKSMGMRVTGKVASYYGDDDALIMVLSEEEG